MGVLSPTGDAASSDAEAAGTQHSEGVPPMTLPMTNPTAGRGLEDAQ
jgi:hypothetical protein